MALAQASLTGRSPVRGPSIGPVVLGELPAQAARTLTSAGWTAHRAGPNETNFTAANGQIFVVDYFDNGRVSLIHKYHDASVTVGGVSVDSTVAQARAALPDWHEVRCATGTLLAPPGGRTYFELPLEANASNDGGNGIDVSSAPVDRNFCG
jgi:hypothetical protein